jgi:diaminohydroxyphosphoribosylaminopyrimidine deaminase/5-amino-6-(5-phosphoribosylamino)uracil reductase
VATRVVLDARASLSATSQLVRTVREAPVLVVAGSEAAESDRRRLQAAGCEMLMLSYPSRQQQLGELLAELGRRRMTNVLVEGGSTLLGTLFDARLVDEVHVFIAPKIIGGHAAATPVAGEGLELMSQAQKLCQVRGRQVEEDFYLCGRLA